MTASRVSDSRLAYVPRRHLVTTGVGRSGTTYLVELPTRLGLDTGFHPVVTRF